MNIIFVVFGNYVLQKLFEYGTPEQVESLALLLIGKNIFYFRFNFVGIFTKV